MIHIVLMGNSSVSPLQSLGVGAWIPTTIN